jgi:hypothetical protein
MQRQVTRRVAVALGTTLFLAPLSAKAGHCDAAIGELGASGAATANGSNSLAVSVRAGVNFEFATFRTQAYEGHFLSLAPLFAVAVQNFSLSLQVPYYWLQRNGLDSNGLGDLNSRLDFHLSPLEALELGAFAGVSPPTGSEQDQLGMGHWMASAGLRTAWTEQRFGLDAQVGYARALIPIQADLHAEHVAGKRPLVDPMNLSELLARAAVSLRVLQQWRVGGSFYTAHPVGIKGSSRGVVSLSSGWVGTWFWTNLAGHVPLYGDPFSWKVSSSLGVYF